jgi:hypothetical protein
MGDVTTGGSSTTPNSKLVGQTSDMLLKGLQDAYKGGVDVYGKPLYTDPSATTQNAWGAGAGFANQLQNAGGFGAGQRDAMDSLGGLASNFGRAAATNGGQLKDVLGGYGRLGDNNGLTAGQGRNLATTNDVGAGFGALTDNNGLSAGQSRAMANTGRLAGAYGGLSGAYDQNAPGYSKLRAKLRNDTATGIYNDFNNSGLFGSDQNMKSAGEGIGNALAGLDYGNYQNSVNNKYRALDSQKGIYDTLFGQGQTGIGNTLAGLQGQLGAAGQAFGMGQQGVGNQFGALAGQAGTSNSMFGNRTAALSGMAGLAGQQFGMGQTALGNQQGAIGLLGQIGASQDADSLARRMADADLFDKTQNRDWNTLGRATSVLGGNATASGSTTSNTIPWWAALGGAAATVGSFL